MTKGMYNDSPAEMEGYIGTVEVCAVMTLYWLASLAPALLHRITYIHTVMVQLYASEKIMQICDNNNKKQAIQLLFLFMRNLLLEACM